MNDDVGYRFAQLNLVDSEDLWFGGESVLQLSCNCGDVCNWADSDDGRTCDTTRHKHTPGEWIRFELAKSDSC